MKQEIEDAFNEVYHERKDKELCPAFIKEVEAKLKNKFDARFNIICMSGTNTSLIFKYRNQTYYIYYLWLSDKFKIEWM